CSSYAGNNVLF
nr:immunoglobulin light chain junction region [Macaca mulatta]MPO03488.1 immunoglobulin light chain junction region [Macaca mulatta]MPO04219.1 immunoglobulin light chain junction region [Macaca mulatta]MPO04222.1 immunoglobulin light chain junction region [Macaca mulatta]MPO04315.1 immunoglobulin light chain junction region [Macaca mulatta]